jgi:hypothetical protein
LDLLRHGVHAFDVNEKVGRRVNEIAMIEIPVVLYINYADVFAVPACKRPGKSNVHPARRGVEVALKRFKLLREAYVL